MCILLVSLVQSHVASIDRIITSQPKKRSIVEVQGGSRYGNRIQASHHVNLSIVYVVIATR